MVTVMVGDFKKEDALDLINKYFGQDKNSNIESNYCQIEVFNDENFEIWMISRNYEKLESAKKEIISQNFGQLARVAHLIFYGNFCCNDL